MIVERLARRCGYDAVAGAMPAGDKRLLIHIRRENLRKQRLRSSEAGSQVRHPKHLSTLWIEFMVHMAACPEAQSSRGSVLTKWHLLFCHKSPFVEKMRGKLTIT